MAQLWRWLRGTVEMWVAAGYEPNWFQWNCWRGTTLRLDGLSFWVFGYCVSYHGSSLGVQNPMNFFATVDSMNSNIGEHNGNLKLGESLPPTTLPTTSKLCSRKELPRVRVEGFQGEDLHRWSQGWALGCSFDLGTILKFTKATETS